MNYYFNTFAKEKTFEFRCYCYLLLGSANILLLLNLFYSFTFSAALFTCSQLPRSMFIRVLGHTVKEQRGKSPQTIFSCQRKERNGSGIDFALMASGWAVLGRVDQSGAFEESVDLNIN